MSKIDINYHSLLKTILEKGYLYDDPNREGVKRLEIPSYTFRYEFKDGFPVISTKKLQYRQVVTELIWFLRGDTNIKYLVDNSCNIWNKDAYNYYCKIFNNEYPHALSKIFDITTFISKIKENKLDCQDLGIYKLGDLGPVYGHQWRNFNGENQILRLIKNLKEQPMATDHIVNSWNAGQLKDMALPPCHYGFQVVVRPLTPIKQANIGHKHNFVYGFELHWSQRSVDTFLGLPYNIASYATLALILEKITGYKALGIQGDLKKVHLYDNSIDAVNEQLSRDVNKYKSGVFDAPILDEIICDGDFDKFINKILPEDITIENYESYPHIKVEMLERDN